MGVSSLTDLKKEVENKGYGLMECASEQVANIMLKRVEELYGPPFYGVCIVRVKEINVYGISFTELIIE